MEGIEWFTLLHVNRITLRGPFTGWLNRRHSHCRNALNNLFKFPFILRANNVLYQSSFPNVFSIPFHCHFSTQYGESVENRMMISASRYHTS